MVSKGEDKLLEATTTILEITCNRIRLDSEDAYCEATKTERLTRLPRNFVI